MYGRIVKFRQDIGVGIIVTETGEAFRFAENEIVNASRSREGVDVDFLVNERRAHEIFLMEGTPWNVFESTRSG